MPYSIDGTPVEGAHEPRLKSGTLWVPLRQVSEALGASVDWDPANQVAIVYLGSDMATLKMGDATVDWNGEKRELQEAPYVEEGEAWVPVRFFEQTLGYKLNVGLENSQVDFTTAAA